MSNNIPRNEKETCAWWSYIVEPEDAYSSVLRLKLGEEDARSWIEADSPGPLPLEIATHGGGPHEWKRVWERWKPRTRDITLYDDFDYMKKIGGKVLTPDDRHWPEGFKNLGLFAPAVLWVRGEIPQVPQISVVGARACTAYGAHVASTLSTELAEAGYAIVSGGAFGIDIAAHRGALAATDGCTCAFMAGGLAQLYPAAHRRYFAEIIERGSLISECPPHWRPARWRFLKRNRLIAAISNMTLVIEASRRSGALATARRAREIGRYLGAVPGPIDSHCSEGCHILIREGATLIRSIRDVVDLLEPMDALIAQPSIGEPLERDRTFDALPQVQRRTWEALPIRSGASLEHLVRESGLSSREVLAALAVLQLNGHVEARPPGWGRTRVSLVNQKFS